jgi:osmotically-inducible protein OsmY
MIFPFDRLSGRVLFGRFSLVLAVAAVVGAAALSGCVPLLVGGAAVGGTMVAIDRRTSGAQIEDQAIEMKSASRINELRLENIRISVTSYNRMALITGEVAREADRQAVEAVVRRVEGVRAVVNDLAVMAPIGVAERTKDSVLSGKVKAAFVDTRDVQAQAAKVVTERGIVYLMGRVTEREAARYADVARTVPGAQKVVRVFEIITEDELAEAASRPPSK